jgi:hypothetical protein
MALQDWVRHEGNINSVPYTTNFSGTRDEQFIMMVRDIQYQDVNSGRYNYFQNLYDIALSNNKNYMHITDNTNAIKDPPNLNNIKRN